NPAFDGHTAYAPLRQFLDEMMSSRVYSKMHTADWWWEIQKRLPRGATVVPVIIASDQTQLSNFSGNKSAWPVYLTIGNIAKSVRRKPSNHATILLGYLPVLDLRIFSEKLQSSKGADLFHLCMQMITAPLVKAGKEGLIAVCPDGLKRKIYPILAAYIANHPEQCLVTCTKQNRCPKCKAAASELGDHPRSEDKPEPRLQAAALTILCAHCEGRADAGEQFDAEGFHPIYPPFWAQLPHADIFSCIAPDLLHQVHKGVFKNHLLEWCESIVGKSEMDHRFRAMSRHPTLRHFTDGISGLKQWTGTEAKEIEKVFIGVVAGALPGKLMLAMQALMDFIAIAQFLEHTSTTLTTMDEKLTTFHKHKATFIAAGGRKLSHFNIPKLHSLEHYTEFIRLFGALDGFNSEAPERLHIDCAKKAYRASNRKGYVSQMTQWLSRQEALHMFRSYLAWTSNQKSKPKAPPSSLTAAPSSLTMAPTLLTAAANPSLHISKFVLAKSPPFRQLSPATISRAFGARKLISALAEYLDTNFPLHRRRPTVYDLFQAYKQVKILVHPVCRLSAPFWDKIQATPPSSSCVRGTKSQIGRFGTVLVRYSCPSIFIRSKGYRTAQVRLIFNLPSTIAPKGHDTPLAYIEWFTAFKSPDPTNGMFKVSRSLDDKGARVAAVVPLSLIHRSCQLIPKWGKVMDVNNADIEKCTNFHVNDFLDLHLYKSVK
ncbi:hypothetical protein BOTBODRAFT_109889, partial [Botryobasidium botryosum FD-172 SS1]